VVAPTPSFESLRTNGMGEAQALNVSYDRRYWRNRLLSARKGEG
jgi:hypothetical protein